jgi:transcription elongation factor GreB
MSRAFVNEDNAAAQADQPVERSISEYPNYVTPAGLAQLHERVAQLQAEQQALQSLGDEANKQRLVDVQRDLRYFGQRAQSAQVVVLAESAGKVQIGNWVTFADEQDNQQRVQLVGEDQADVGQGLVNWASPLGRRPTARGPGDEVVWKRPVGDLAIEIVEIGA